MRTLVLGGYGLIGAEVMRCLVRAQGFVPVGFGRDIALARRLFPDREWVQGDLLQLQRADDWLPLLKNIDAVVNCAGVLQDGSRDRLVAVHEQALGALVDACGKSGVRRFVHISAPGSEPGSPLAFYATKAAGDAMVRASDLEWTILKPGLVLAQGAYGGSALLRSLAACPLIQPLLLADAPVQTVAASDVADAVRAALSNELPARCDYDLVEPSPHSLGEVVLAVRRWSGRTEPLATWHLPRWFGYAVARVADWAGWLGWRSALRTTALRALEVGITGNVENWHRATGRYPHSLEQTLADMPATAQERISARARLVFPLLLLTLAVFWIGSGLVAIARLEQAVDVLRGAVAPVLARWLVLAGAVVDLAIGCLLLVRRWTLFAAWASVAVAATYLALGSWLTPHLWLDPMGVFVKVLPAMGLAIAVAALLEER